MGAYMKRGFTLLGFLMMHMEALSSIQIIVIECVKLGSLGFEMLNFKIEQSYFEASIDHPNIYCFMGN